MWYPVHQFSDCAYEYVVGERFEMQKLERCHGGGAGAGRFQSVTPRDAVAVVEGVAHRMRGELRHLVGSATHYTNVSGYTDQDVLRIALSELGSIAGRLALLRRRHARFVMLATPKAPPRAMEPGPEPESTWYEIELVDQDGRPIADAAYELTLPSGRTRSGALDANGRARVDVDGERGSARVMFTDLLADHLIGPEGERR